MSNTDVFGSPMILTGRKAVSPFGAAMDTRSGDNRSGEPVVATVGRWLTARLGILFEPLRHDRRIRKTVIELSKLDDRVLRDIGLDRSAIISAAHEADKRKGRRYHR